MKREFYKLLSGAKQGLFALALTVFLGTAYAQTTIFNATGNVQTYNLLQPGNYQIECWGANGADGTYYSAMSPNNLIDGGRGGYSVGFFNAAAPMTLYVVVGGIGSNALSGNNPGGYNGGGNSSSAPYQAGSGGGASHVATAPGLLSSLSGNQGAVLIVAGGGGGGGNQSLGGNAGGLNGVQPPPATQFGNRTAGGGGTQNAGGTCFTSGFGAGFGQGGTTTQNLAGGGGGGWYGGCTGDNSTAGGGGSGYIGGVTNGTTVGQGQPGFVPNPDVTGNGRVVITRLCNISLNASSNPICIGQSVTLSTDAASGITWSGSGSTGNSIVVSPNVTTSYTVAGTSTANCQTSSVITVTVNPLPVLAAMVTPTTLCVGNTATILANGASTYTWNGGPTGPSLQVNPAVNTTYNLSGTSQFGCLNSATVLVSVNSNSLTVTQPPLVCAGSSLLLSTTGAVTYTWSTGLNFANLPVAAATTTNYVVTGTDMYGCVLSETVNVLASPKPTITVTSKNVVCKGEPISMTAAGADTYSWSSTFGPAFSGPSVSASFPVNVIYVYTVTGTNSDGCTGSSIVSLNVVECVGLNELKNDLGTKVYPNPASNEITIDLNNNSEKLVEITDIEGRLVISESSAAAKFTVGVSKLADGIYYVKVTSSGQSSVTKIIKESGK